MAPQFAEVAPGLFVADAASAAERGVGTFDFVVHCGAPDAPFPEAMHPGVRCARLPDAADLGEVRRRVGDVSAALCAGRRVLVMGADREAARKLARA